MIHGWGGSPESDWFPWAKKELESRDFEVFVPEMPDTDNPKIDSWIQKIKETVGEVKPNDIFIGHSIGCQAIERFLETLPEDEKIEKAILVAPWTTLKEQTFTDLETDRSVAEPWLSTPINYQKIGKMSDRWISIFSDDDPYVDYEENFPVYKDKLGAKIYLKHGLGHIAGEQGITELPLLLDFME